VLAPDRCGIHHEDMGVRRVIVVFPARADLTAVERFRGRWDPLADAVPAHVTLVYPFQDGEDVDGVANAVAQVTARHRPFAFDLASPQIVADEYLFLVAEQGREQIHRLHHDLDDAVPNAYTSGMFLAHMTIGRSQDRARLDQAHREAVRTGLCLHGQAEAVSIYRIDSDGNRQVEVVLPLGHP
jgi:2'-5' RNA ligase